MLDDPAEKLLMSALRYNGEWFSKRARRFKHAHYALQFATIFLPLVTMLVELLCHVVALNLALLFLVSILASLNVVLSPLNNWRRFKRAEIELGAVMVELQSELVAAREDVTRRAQAVTAHTGKTREILLRYADDHFADLEARLEGPRPQ